MVKGDHTYKSGYTLGFKIDVAKTLIFKDFMKILAMKRDKKDVLLLGQKFAYIICCKKKS